MGRTVQYLPTSRGFDHYFGIPYSNDMNPRPLLDGTQVVEEPSQPGNVDPALYRTRHAIHSLLGWISVLLYLPHTFPHIPLAASDRFRGKSSQGLYGDVVEELDWSVGEVLK